MRKLRFANDTSRRLLFAVRALVKSGKSIQAQSAENDKVHDRLLAELKARNTELNEKNDANDAEHARLLQELELNHATLEAKVDTQKASPWPLIVAVVALVASSVSMVLTLQV